MPTLEDSKVQFRSVAALLSGVAVLVVAIIGATWKIANVLGSVAGEMKELRTSLDDVRSNSYTLTKASEQALRSAIENPSLRVPDPRDPNKLIIVYSAKTSESAKN